jgi:hypothetical protein
MTTGLYILRTRFGVFELKHSNSTITRSFLLQDAEHATSECDYRDKPGAMRLAATVYIAGEAILC